MLNGFQGDLSSISTEIQSLQDQSIAMNVKLKNRQVLFDQLNQMKQTFNCWEKQIKKKYSYLSHALFLSFLEFNIV